MSALIMLALMTPAAFAIEGVRVEVGDGSVLERATVLVGDDGRIVAVGDDVKVPKGAEHVDGTGRTLAPGFIETRGALGLAEILFEETTVDYSMRSAQPITPAFRVVDGFNPVSVRIPIERAEGVTSTIATPVGGLIAGQAYWFDLTGERTATPDAGKPTSMIGNVSQSAMGKLGGSRGALWLKLREVFDDARFYKKNKAAYDRAATRELALPRVHLEALQPVLAGKLPLVLQANRAADIQAALRFTREEKVKLIVTGGAEAWVVAKELKAAGVPVILHPSQQAPHGFDHLRARDDAAEVLRKAGVTVVLTANGGWDQNARRIRQEAGYAVAHGYPRAQALRAITLTPAEVFGKGKELGSIAKGKRANLVLWSGDPLELSSVAERIWIDGAPMSLDNRQRALAERYLQRKR